MRCCFNFAFCNNESNRTHGMHTAQTGVYTDPSSGACTNASNPAAALCAYGSGAACVTCPTGALCPGGSRLWPRPGFWVARESTASVSACAPPDPGARCLGWSVSRGVSLCGLGYLEGSFLCGACAPSFYLADDGACSACPVVTGPWDRYRGLLVLFAGVVGFVGVVGVGLFIAQHFTGGSMAGGAKQLLSLGIWTLTALQTVSQVSRWVGLESAWRVSALYEMARVPIIRVVLNKLMPFAACPPRPFPRSWSLCIAALRHFNSLASYFHPRAPTRKCSAE